MGNSNNLSRSFFYIFLDGVLSFFGICDNPIAKYRKSLKGRTDYDKISNDWANVGNDIKNAYERFKASKTTA